MNHLETLIKQYYEWRGYIVRSNVKVGRLRHGGWAGELDIVAYHPVSEHLLHLEPSFVGVGGDPGKAENALGLTRVDIKEGERPHEEAVSRRIRTMPFLWIAVEDVPGPTSARGLIERNAIGLLSNFNKEPLDVPSDSWLGHSSGRERVRKSGLWNNNHVDEPYEPAFLDTFSLLVKNTVS